MTQKPDRIMRRFYESNVNRVHQLMFPCFSLVIGLSIKPVMRGCRVAKDDGELIVRISYTDKHSELFLCPQHSLNTHACNIAKIRTGLPH